MNVVAIGENVADVDPDAEGQPAVLRHARRAGAHAALDLHRAFHGLDDAVELREHPVAHELDDPAAAGAYRRGHEFVQVRLEGAQRPGLVHAHQAAVTDDVGCEHSSESAFHARPPEASVRPSSDLFREGYSRTLRNDSEAGASATIAPVLRGHNLKACAGEPSEKL